MLAYKNKLFARLFGILKMSSTTTVLENQIATMHRMGTFTRQTKSNLQPSPAIFVFPKGPYGFSRDECTSEPCAMKLRLFVEL